VVYVTATEANLYPGIKAYERREYDRFSAYLERLDAGGWVEQSYCTDWLVYQVVSHIGSGSRIGSMRVNAWVNCGPPASREVMQGVWGLFDSQRPDQVLATFSEAASEYLATEAATPDAAGLQEVDGFAGRRPLAAYQLARVWELACHTWDVYVARDRAARLDRDAVDLLVAGMQYINLPLDKERGAALVQKPVVFRLLDSGTAFTLDPAAERPRVQPGATADAPLVVEAPDEELLRFLGGRHFVPGATPELKVVTGSAQDLANLRRALR
jgi:uncharacterized protein (TIGR03083 family)